MLRSIIAISMLVAAAPAVAQDAAQPQLLVNSKPAKDPNKVVCEKVETIGSRIASKRVCMTVAQWDEQKRIDREALMHAQQNTGHGTTK